MTNLILGYFYVSLIWILFVFVMGMYRAKLENQLTKAAWVLGWWAVLLAWLLDWVGNWTLASLVFREWPQEPAELVTGRLQRYLDGEAGYRHSIASWVCSSLLDYIDPRGYHCRKPTT